MSILNVPLYNALIEVAGAVSLVREGEEGELEIEFEGGNYRAVRCRGGEEYRINCPVCGDRRKRLYISHWAFRPVFRKDAKVFTSGLMYCQNEKCDMREVRTRISAVIKPDAVSPMVVREGRKAKSEDNVELPAGCLPINSPEAPVAARSYLLGRGFDLDELHNVWEVKCCEHLPEYVEHGPKIIYPIRLFNKLIGWQARLCWDPNRDQLKQGIRKYYFLPGVSKSDMLYNRDKARQHDVTVIVEGVTDVHRVGESAVAIFGKVPSVRQTQILKNVFGYNLGVMLLDSDADEEAERYVRLYGKNLFEKGLHLVKLTEGDPASHTREEIWDIITTQIARSISYGNRKV